MPPSFHDCATDLLEVVPLIMRAMRAEVRRHRAPELSMPQFRALAFLGRNEGAALSDVATFLALTLPSASKLIDGLVAVGFVHRATAAGDRRRVHLALTEAGNLKYRAIDRQAHAFLVDKVAHFTPAQRQQLRQSLAALRQTFDAEALSESPRTAHSRASGKLPR